MIHCRNCKYAKQLVDPYTKKNMDAFCCDLLLETLSMMGQAIKIYYDNIRVLGSFGCILGKKKAASQSVSPRFSKSTGWRCRVDKSKKITDFYLKVKPGISSDEE